jgi:hypothetical protein
MSEAELSVISESLIVFCKRKFLLPMCDVRYVISKAWSEEQRLEMAAVFQAL